MSPRTCAVEIHVRKDDPALRTLFLGVDPGWSGAVAILGQQGAVVRVIRMDETEDDIADMLAAVSPLTKFAVVERVNAMPGQGVSSMFKFGMAYGFVLGILAANHVRREFVPPVKWQNAMSCRTKGDKNITKAAAQRLFPCEKVTHRTADALLLAEYARRLATERGW